MDEGTGRAPSRRDFLVMGAGVFAVSTLGLSLTRRRLVRRTIPVMGTIADIAVVTRDERTAQGAIDAAVAELYDVERRMSRFDAASEIGRANRAAYGTAVVVSAATAAVVEQALCWARADGSSFDPALGRVVELWDVAHRTQPPPERGVRRLANRTLHRGVGVDRAGGVHRIVFDSPDIALDLGGIAKGYAVDRAVAALRAWGVTDGLVNAGGDLYALGTADDREPWSVGVRSPFSAGIAHTISLSNRAIATSGDYEQFFEHGGRRYHHLLDPRTAAPRVTAAHSLSIAADTCMSADAAATAAYGLGDDAARRLLRRAAPDAGIILLA